MPLDQVRATPRNSALGAVADFLAQSYSPERTQQMQGVSKFLGIPAVSETLNLLSYDPSGRSLFTGAGGLGGTTRFRPEVPDAAMVVAPMAGPLAQVTGKVGKAGARVLGEELNRAILDSSGPLAKLIPPAVKPMYIVPPQGNLNLTPISRAEILKGPNVQNPESFLNQLRGKPGMTQEGFDDLVKQYQGLEPGTRMTKADFEQRIPASRYNKVDLANSAESADAHLLEQANEMVMEDRYNVYEYMLDRLGVRVNRGNLHMLDEYHANNLTFEQLSPELQRGLTRVEATTPDSMNVLDDIFAEERDNAVNNTFQTLREQDFAHSGLEPGGYAYRDYQRLLENPVASESGYFELGVSHPDQMVSYKHYPGHEGEEGLIGHVRGTFISADAPDEARQLINPLRFKRIPESDKAMLAKPNSMVIEEIQSDAQKGKAQTGALRQAHGTVFKAAIQHALENGADTVYYPTSEIISHVRSKASSAYAPIYDQQIVNEGLKPLLRIPGVNSSKIGDAYHEITFTPEAKDFILKGEGQTAPGMAKGGAVHMDEGGAAFGVFPQMKPRRAKQDREAAANAPLSALRGYAAGTAGLPGDIEGLARMAMSQVPSQFLNAMPALRAFGIGSRANPTPQLPTTEFYNEYLPGAQLNQTPTGKAFTTAGNLLGGTGSTNIAGLGVKGTAELANLAARIAAESPRAGSRAAQLGVIKMPGGNFLKGGIEDAVRPMKRGVVNEEAARRLMGDAFTNERMADPVNNALNTFIDKKIVPYIKNEMATPGDPLRAMAEKYAVDKPAKLAEVQGRIDAFAAKMEQTARERGVPVGDLTSMRQQMIGLEKEKALVEAREGLHFTPDEEQYSRYIQNRKAAGTDMSGMGQSPLAKSWENVSDSALGIDDAGYLLNPREQGRIMISERLESNPWLAKVPPETKVYSARSMLPERTGFNHLVDELRNATNPESGLPKNLLIDPADLSKLTMAQAVDRVADINAWRATQKAEADLLRANNAATQVVKEYPEQGMKWVELKTPEAKLPEGVSVVKYGDLYHVVDDVGNSLSVGATEKEALNLLSRSERETTLADALKYEGDTMAHCVGGYCPDVVEGRSRIYSRSRSYSYGHNHSSRRSSNGYAR